MAITRRTFLTTSAEIISCTALASGLPSCGIGSLFYSSGDIPIQEGIPSIHLSEEPALRNIGGAVKKKFKQLNDGNVIVIVRTEEKKFNAFAAQCTHWGAEVELPKDGIFVCPFHGSRFSTNNGTVIEGPASDSLQQFKIEFDEKNDELRIEN